MHTTQEDIINLIKKVVYSHKINKKTSAEELINVAYVYIHEKAHYLEKLTPEQERARIVTLARTGIKVFYRDYHTVRLPKTKNRTQKVIDKDMLEVDKRKTYSTLEAEYLSTKEINGASDKIISKERKETVIAIVKEAMEYLSNVETYIIENRYAVAKEERLTIREIAEKLGATTSNIAYIEKKALKKLRTLLRNYKEER